MEYVYVITKAGKFCWAYNEFRRAFEFVANTLTAEDINNYMKLPHLLDVAIEEMCFQKSMKHGNPDRALYDDDSTGLELWMVPVR